MRWIAKPTTTNFAERVGQMRRLMRRLSLIIGVAIAIAVPSGYFVAGYFALKADLGFKAQLSSERLAQHAYIYGPTWMYGVEHLTDLVSLTTEADMAVRQLIWEDAGGLVYESTQQIASPLLWRRRPILVADTMVGTVAVGTSLLPLLTDTGFVALLGLLLGTAAWLAMHRLPERSLKETLDALRHAHEETRKQAAETAAAYDELQRQYRIVEETTEELMHARDDALSADRSKSAFLATMSHELRTPLNAIIGFSDMMRSRILGELGHDQYADYVEDIHQSGQHLLAIVNDVLDLSKIEAGRMVLHVEPVDLTELIDDCYRLMGARVAEAGIGLAVSEAAEPLPAIMADAVKLKQIILNLLSNSVKFTPRDGVVTIAAARINDLQVVISVSDTGIGMAADDVAVAMQPFQQVDNTISRRFQGTGLGLPLARALAEQHGGRLAIDSAKGQGTTVTITLPIYGPPAYRDLKALQAQGVPPADRSSRPDAGSGQPQSQALRA